MKQVLTTNIVAGVRGLVGSKQTLAHLQEALIEITTSIIKNFTENTTNYFKLHGLEDSDGSATAWNISAGAIYFNGEVYQVDAFTGSHATNVPVLVLETTYRAGDPVKYSDNNEFNTHEVRKLKLQMGASGSGLVNYSALQELGQGWVTDTRLASKFLKSGDGKQLLHKELDIVDWNMMGDYEFSIAHGLPDHTKIKAVFAQIRTDSGSEYKGFVGKDVDYISWDSTNVDLAHIVGSAFDSVTFNLTPYLRGVITILYEA